MARPRIFISSTFYDLRHVRDDVERMIRELGYDPVRNENAGIPYSKEERLETSAYREVELSDVIVSIVGGRYGSEAKDDPGHSISQAELRRALDRGIQVFIFVEKSVLAEYATYQLNKETAGVRYRFVDDVRVFEFLEDMFKLPRNNPIAPFETSAEITQYLKLQFAGLFQRFLQEQRRVSEVRVLEEMNSVAKTLKEVVGFLTEERKSRDQAIRSILLANHPVFRRLADLTHTTYRVYFSNRQERDRWLAARGWKPVPREELDEESLEEWINEKSDAYLKFTAGLFDENENLLIFTPEDWDDSWISRVTIKPKPSPTDDDDDVPF